MRALLAAVALVSLNAAAQTINLDKPGALAALQKQRPDHYRTVLGTVRAAQRMNCPVDLKAYQAGDMKKACTSHSIRTSYPAQVVLFIPLDRMQYTITAYLDHSLDRIAHAQ